MKKIIPLVLAAIIMTISILLMILLKGVEMVFAYSPQQTMYESYSYIDGMVFGYGNWLPLISIIMAFVSLVLILISIFRYKRSKSPNNTSIVCSVISIAASLLSFLMFGSLNAASILIVALIAFSILLQYIAFKKMEN